MALARLLEELSRERLAEPSFEAGGGTATELVHLRDLSCSATDRTLAPPRKACAYVRTMNVPEEDLPRCPPKMQGIDFNWTKHERTFSCPCHVFPCCDTNDARHKRHATQTTRDTNDANDTRQFDDCSKYDNTMFDPAHKEARFMDARFTEDASGMRASGKFSRRNSSAPTLLAGSWQAPDVPHA